MSKATIVLVRSDPRRKGRSLSSDIEAAKQAARARSCWVLLVGAQGERRRAEMCDALGIRPGISQDGIHVYAPEQLVNQDDPEALAGYLVDLGFQVPLRQKSRLEIKLPADFAPTLLAAVVEAASVYPRTCVWLGEQELRCHVRWEVRRDRFRSPPPSPQGNSLIGAAPMLDKVREKIANYADKPYPVLIIGETGTGKELVARMLHEQSAREGRFMAQNAAQLSPELADSLLFGHEEGSFTGASRKRPGRIREAKNGTFFLDEAFNLHPAVQGKLLRALNKVEEGIILVESVGSTRTDTVPARLVVSALGDPRTNSGKRGTSTMRMDLFYRVSAGIIRLPCLKNCLEDLPKLCVGLLAKLKRGVMVDDDGIAVLQNYEWPGNVRELRLILIRALMDGPDNLKVLSAAHLRAALSTSALPPGARSLLVPCDLAHELKKIEVATMNAAMRKTGKRPSEAGVLIGMSPDTARNFKRRHEAALKKLKEMNDKKTEKSDEQ